MILNENGQFEFEEGVDFTYHIPLTQLEIFDNVTFPEPVIVYTDRLERIFKSQPNPAFYRTATIAAL